MDYQTIIDSAYTLYAGGWRANDYEWIIDEYGLDDEDAENICAVLSDIDREYGGAY